MKYRKVFHHTNADIKCPRYKGQYCIVLRKLIYFSFCVEVEHPTKTIMNNIVRNMMSNLVNVMTNNNVREVVNDGDFSVKGNESFSNPLFEEYDGNTEMYYQLRLPSDDEFEKNKQMCIDNSYAYCEFCGKPHCLAECKHIYIQDYKDYIMDFLSLVEDREQMNYELSQMDYIHLLVLSTILDCPCVGVKTKNKMIRSIAAKIEVVQLYSVIVPKSRDIFQKVFDKKFSFAGFGRITFRTQT